MMERVLGVIDPLDVTKPGSLQLMHLVNIVLFALLMSRCVSIAKPLPGITVVLASCYFTSCRWG